ncbi:MAG: type II toxin-antitoxin system VapC family toxin [Pseudonocardiaceae bacterium]
MIVLDTNVLSELTRQAPDAAVLAWLDSLPTAEVATTAVTAGRRNRALAEAVHALINDDFRGRVEPFDTHAAAQYAIVVTVREKLGRPITVADAQIAAICRSRDTVLATRNTRDFEDTDIELVNPWHAC